jgi:cell division septum initiation protein DivIVA
MRYTPVELRHVKLGKSLFGYRKEETEKVLEEVADSFEEVWRERGELADKLEDIEKVLAEVKQREQLLTSALVSAERAAADAREQAKREAEVIVAEAHQEARSITRTAQGERERLFADVRRVETLLRAALGMVEDSKGVLPGASVEPGEVSESWPKRQDTREFKAGAAEPAQLPPVQPEGERPAGDDVPWEDRDFAWG